VPGDADKGPTASCAPGSAPTPACPGRSRSGAVRASVSLLLALGVTLSGCAELAGPLGIQEERERMTYAKFLARARAGDAESRNLLGFMLFFGEGIPGNRAGAHSWFHAAADQGNLRAQRNLAVMHYLGAGVPRDLAEAERYFRLARENVAASADAGSPFQVYGSIGEVVERVGARAQTEQRPGEALYVTYCAGCHGLNGVAAYVGSPSFAMGERLERGDAALLRSILNGIGDMPEWGSKLPRGELVDVLRFVRSFPSQHELGILQELRKAPGMYFLFGPMRQNPAAYRPGDEDDVEAAIKRRRP